MCVMDFLVTGKASPLDPNTMKRFLFPELFILTAILQGLDVLVDEEPLPLVRGPVSIDALSEPTFHNIIIQHTLLILYSQVHTFFF